MVVGFNHNFRYKGVLYHVQTEDGGVKNPVIITHLFTGGTILSSKKTSYADILKSDRLEQVVEDLMKEQHREMLRRLRDGELDEAISSRQAAASLTAAVRKPAAPAPEAPPVPLRKPAAVPQPEPTAPLQRPAPARAERPASVAARVAAAAATRPAAPSPRSTVVLRPVPPPEKDAEAAGEVSLDDLILSYLLGDGGKKP